MGVSKGHYYLTLVEKEAGLSQPLAQLEAVLWSSQFNKLKRQHGGVVGTLLQSGHQVKLKVSVQFHERFGFKLIVEDIDPVHTMGQLELQRQATLERLVAAGATGKNAKLALPLAIQRLALISSETAAGYADFTQQLTQNAYGFGFKTELFPATMQGQQAPAELIAALRRIERRKRYFDAIVIIRGGGARMDLIAFDDEKLCEQAAAASLPIITGIGHETDKVLLDHVAHTALKTPTAAASFLIETSLRLESFILQYAQQIGQVARQRLLYQERQLDHFVNGLQLAKSQRLQTERNRLDMAATRLPTLAATTIEKHKNKLDHLEALVAANDPEKILAKGYALLSQEGKRLYSVGALEKGKPLSIRMEDGEVDFGN